MHDIGVVPQYQKAPNWRLRLSILFCFYFLICAPSAFAFDEIESELSKEIVAWLEPRLEENLTENDRAYIYFLLSVHKRDSKARGKAEEIFKKLGTPESKAYLGSIETLKARDFAGGGIVQTIVSLTPAGFIRLHYVQRGIKMFDKAVTENPHNLEIRLTRALTYFGLPSVFGKFDEGLNDVETILKWLDVEGLHVTEEEELLRGKCVVYYYAGRYFLNAGKVDKAKELFLKSAELSKRSPFAISAQRRLSK